MKKIIKKHYDLPKVENHFIEKKVSDLVDGDLILEFLEYKSHTRADFLEEPSCQKNLYKVFIFRETKKTLLMRLFKVLWNQYSFWKIIISLNMSCTHYLYLCF